MLLFLNIIEKAEMFVRATLLKLCNVVLWMRFASLDFLFHVYYKEIKNDVLKTEVTSSLDVASVI